MNRKRLVFMVLIMLGFFIMAYQAIAEDYSQLQIRITTDAIKANPNDAQAYYQRGGIYLNNGYIDKAILDYNKAIEINPKFAVAYFDRATAYEWKGNDEQAISDYSKAIENSPLFITAYQRRAALYLKQGEYDKSQQEIDRIKEIESSEEFKKGQQEILKDFQKALDLE